MRIAMGIAYCLEYMHELKPPIAHRNLQSSFIYLTEDYAAKISDLSLWIVRVIDVKNANTIEHACDRKGRRKRKSIKGDEEIQLYAKFELQKK